MAPGKARNSKRSSGSSSHASTVTTAVFIAIGVLGVWVLTSNSVTTPQTTRRTAISTSTSTAAADYSSTAKNSVFEDNPGQLPDEAIQSDDSAQSKKINAQEKSQAENSNDSMNKQILTENADEAAESNIYKENQQNLQGKESVEEQEKQKLPETRVSEESSTTEGQQVEERTMEQERKPEETTQTNFEGEDSQKTRDEPESDGKEDAQESKVLEETQMNVEADRHHGSLQDPISDKYQQQTREDELQKEEEEQKQGEDGQRREDEQESNGKEEVRESRVIDETQRNAEADHHGNLQDQISYKDQQKTGQDEQQREEEEQKQQQTGQDEEQTEEEELKQQQTGQDEQQREEEEKKQQHTGQDEQQREEEEEEEVQKQQQTGQEEQQREEEQKQQQTGQDEQQREEEEQTQQQKEQLEQEIQEGTSHDQIEHGDTAPLQLSSKIEDQKPRQATATAQTHVNDSETQNDNSQHENNSKIDTKRKEEKATQSNSDNSVLEEESSEIPKESKESKKSWSTQADQSENEKERHKRGTEDQDGSIYEYEWQLCNVTAGTDYIPCLDNEKAISKLRSRGHFEHRERHCPEEAPTCLVPLPEGYKRPVEWPTSRQKIWYHNVPHAKLAEMKGHQNWLKVTGEFLTFPGGGTQFIHGALHYIDFVQQAAPKIEWGKHTRVVLDVGCGVASFGGYLFDRDVLAMSFAPKDEHEAQVQFALERGIPAISAVMGSQRLPFPSMVFDLVHCARCRVPWHAEGGALLLELNRVLRPGGYFVWSATPVYQKLKEDAEIWKEMSALTESMCWDLVTIKKDKLNSVGVAIYHKPVSNVCYDQRKQSHPPMCDSDDDPNAAWYVALQSCMHRLPVDKAERGSQWPEKWPNRIQTPPYWLNKSHMGIYGKPAPDDFVADYKHWKSVVRKMYLSGLGISWNNVRNIMDMRAVYGGFAAAMKDLKVWVLNVVNVDSPDTLPIIYERGLFGIYHDWCESFSTYPRTFDLLHADHLFSRLKKRCKLVPVMAEIDRIVRPGGKLIIRDESSTINEVENLLKSMRWEVHLTFSKNEKGILSAQKSDWRPDSYAASF